MKRSVVLAALLLCCCALMLTVTETTEAARLGGGRSFGGKPFMSTPAPAVRPHPAPGKPGPTVNQTRPQQQQPAAGAARPGLFGGMGGLMGGLLAGTLIGSLLSGHGFSGGGFMDILLFGLLIYLGLKLFARFRGAPAAARAGAGQGQNAEEQPLRREAADGWGALRSTPQDMSGSAEDGPAVSVPQGFDVEEFLRGAKMAYNRLQQAWDKRDMDDISQFATPAVQEEVRRQMEADPRPGNTELLLVNAHLLQVENDGPDQYAQVFFDVLLREDPNQQAPTSVREVWHFVRPVAGGMWKLDGIQQVEG
jgi:predicted lipid-binding transport protein (Tim44 family)